ncbi:D-alanyl-D-alanine carboxypeptidase family protein [Pseudobutyrivibrio sp. YE44]|uniref:D-alanyl-D-alanine carboxypeptidase family protein n=1 Tax=Pseudobutyrivibrio sp. YE44 TaxID=1520802 RepID=UPI000B00C404|nr:serine hydrolase [Pseudobutyrivibrio sp. YE44]
MKCINKYISLFLVITIALSLISCGKADEDITSYKLYDTSDAYGITHNGASSDVELFAKDLCVTGNEDLGTSSVDSQVASGAAAFNITEQTCVYAQSVHEKLYPASTTKILTAYIACLKGNLDDYYTVSENAVDQASDSSVINLKAGDVISLRDLLYGLMLRSGNDAAVAIAEGICGDVETFANLMNETAINLGATNSHFVTPNGLHDENHYTTVYDMYLILNAAIQNPDFYTIFTATSYTANYTSGGTSKTVDWRTTNQYLSGNVHKPNGFSILGGKTGTTGAAGYCLVLLSENEDHDKIISIVFNADCRSNLYLLMNEMLSNYCI